MREVFSTRESKDERFRRVAQARVNKIIRMIRLLGNCARTQTYAYTEGQAEQIFCALQTELNAAKNRFTDADKRRFSLTEEAEAAADSQFPKISLELPDGSYLHATAYQTEPYPSINIERVTKEGGAAELVCFAEFNHERGEHGQLCIGAYRSDQDDTTYYKPYDAAEGE